MYKSQFRKMNAYPYFVLQSHIYGLVINQA